MRRPQQAGFSLILSLMIMAALVLLIVTLASFLQIESRVAGLHTNRTKARLNALVAGRLAVAQLQTLVGHDQRVTARADLLDIRAEGTILNSYLLSQVATRVSPDKKWWTGVWCTGGADQSKVRDWSVSNPDDRLFLGFLVSADPTTGLPMNNLSPSRLLKTSDRPTMESTLRSVRAGADPGQRLITLLNYGTMAPDPTQDGQVKIPALPLSLNNPQTEITLGSYAWWTSDESVKAKINLSETLSNRAKDWDLGYLFQQARRNGQETLGGASPAWPNFKRWSDQALGMNRGLALHQIATAPELSWWANLVSGDITGNVSQNVASTFKKYYGDITLQSYGVLSDTYNGGLKTDLSLAFELPHEDYKLLKEFHDSPGAPGDRNWANLAKDYGFTAANTPSYAEWGDPTNKLGFVFEAPIPNLTSGPSVVPPVISDPSLINQAPPYVNLRAGFQRATQDYEADDWTVRGPTWLLFRNYYRLYKRELETIGARGQPKSSPDAWFARCAEPFTYSSGVTGWSGEGDSNASNYLGEKFNAGMMHRKARMKIIGGTNWARSNFTTHQFARIGYAANGGSYPQPTAMKLAPVILRHTQRWGVIYNQDTLGVTFDPLITLHNPYNVALELTGFGAYLNKYYPLGLTFVRLNTTTGIEEPLTLTGLNTNDIRFDNGVFHPQNNYSSRAVAIRWVAPQGSVLRFAPGEVIVIGCQSSTNSSLKNNYLSMIHAERTYNPDKARHYYKILSDADAVKTATKQYPLVCRLYANWVPQSNNDPSPGYWDGMFVEYNLMHHQRDNGSTTFPLSKMWGGQNYAECDGSDEGLLNRTGFFTAFYPDAISSRKIIAQKTLSQTSETANDANLERTFIGVLDLRWRSPSDAKQVDAWTANEGRGVGGGSGSPLVADPRYDATDPRDWDGDSLQSPPMILSMYPDPGAITPVHMNQANQGYYGDSYTSGVGRNAVIQFEIPQRPLISLTALGHIPFGLYATQPAYTVGNSYAHLGLPDLTKTLHWPNTCVSPPGQISQGTAEFGTDNGNTSAIRIDSVFLANLALWDRYFFSGLHVAMPNTALHELEQDRSVRFPDPAVVNAGQPLATPGDVWDSLAQGNHPLANPRLIWGRYNSTCTDAELRRDFYVEPTSKPRPKNESPAKPERLARQFLYNGSFNVNSTSKEAWRLILSGLRNIDGTNATCFSRFSLPAATHEAPIRTNFWGLNYFRLTDAEIDKLATSIVAEVHRRGPFMCVADFINRRLTAEATGLKGPLQAAIDNAGLNDHLSKPGKMRDDFNTKVTTAGGRFPQAKAYDPAAYDKNNSTSATGSFPIQAGSNGHLLQMDLLNAIGGALTVRGDTFTIRAYGDSFTPQGVVAAKAWVEITVQRLPELFIPDEHEPTVALGALPADSTIVAPSGVNAPGNNVGGGGGFGGYRSPLITTYGTAPIMERWVRNTDALRLNHLFGRRFKVINLRWLAENEL